GCHGVRLTLDFPGTIGREELAEVLHCLATNAGAAMWQLVRPDVLFKVSYRIQRAPRFQHDHAESTLCENFRGRAAARAGADDADVVSFRGTDDLRHADSVFLCVLRVLCG